MVVGAAAAGARPRQGDRPDGAGAGNAGASLARERRRIDAMARRAARTDGTFIDQCLMLASRWAEVGPAAIGLTEADRQAFADLAALAHEKARVARARRQAARSATIAKRAALSALRKRFGALTRRIEGFALTSPTPARVYADAAIGVAGSHGPLPAPERPVPDAVVLLADGSALVTFAGRFEGATMEVQRAVNRAGAPWAEFEHLGSFKGGAFYDLYPPQGALSIWYRARLLRGGTGKASEWSNIAVLTFGRARPQAGELVRAA
jgi:hypothetical protein